HRIRPTTRAPSTTATRSSTRHSRSTLVPWVVAGSGAPKRLVHPAQLSSRPAQTAPATLRRATAGCGRGGTVREPTHAATLHRSGRMGPVRGRGFSRQEARDVRSVGRPVGRVLFRMIEQPVGRGEGGVGREMSRLIDTSVPGVLEPREQERFAGAATASPRKRSVVAFDRGLLTTNGVRYRRLNGLGQDERR